MIFTMCQGFNIQSRLQFDRDIEKYGQNCNSGKPVIDYYRCSDKFNGLYSSASDSFDKYARRHGATIIPSMTALVWPGLSFQAHMGRSVPAWSKAKRPVASTFARWIFEGTSHCEKGSHDNTVCANTATGSISSVIPWFGGDYNPWESCDTITSDGEIHEAITAACHSTICTGADQFQSPFYANQPSGKTRCYDMDGEQVTRLNVPSTYETNLCRQKPLPEVDAKVQRCQWEHGMLMGYEGSSHSDLYQDATPLFRDSIIAETGSGLFIKGGNPIYYTAKGTVEELKNELMHTILRSHPDDLGGHHMVLRLLYDEENSKNILSVRRLPLTSLPESTYDDDRSSLDPVETVYDSSLLSSLSTVPTLGWLSNLAGNMRYEQSAVDVLYPLPSSITSTTEKEWSCPLLRIAFWSQVVESFSPLSPSPVRAARLFGGSSYNMIHGTRSHPTQMFSSLFSRLGNIHTSNGFCYCLEASQCQVLHSSSQNSDCTLLETIRSLYDQKFRVAKVLTTASSDMCLQQLDWPFEPGIMRDGTFNKARNDPAKACNVMDRLPLFQYRYRPVGKVHAPADSSKTSLSQGGSCHMGRAVHVPPPVSTATTQICRKIHTNFTHVVVRCAGAQNTYTDYELPKEKSAAPDWMVERLRTEKRQKCDVCSAVPVWRTEDGMQDLPHGPEVSYGIPFRWSASRLLAAELKDVICMGGRHNNTDQCNSLLNLSSPDAFSEAFFGSGFFTSSSSHPNLLDAMDNFSATLQSALDEDLFLWGGTETPGKTLPHSLVDELDDLFK